MTTSTKGAKHGYFIIIVIAIGIPAVWFGHRCALHAGTDPHTYKIDYNVFYMAWQSVLDSGGNPYAEQISPATPYLYPLLFAQLFSPLGLLSVRAAAAVWYAIGIASVLASLFFCERLVTIDKKLNVLLIVLTFLSVARFTLDN